MASHEPGDGWLDYGSGRYKLMGRPNREDHYLHAGEWLEVWIGRQWLRVQVLADKSGRWFFRHADGSPVVVQLGMPARSAHI